MKEVLAEIITVGDEILYGQTLDSNAHWLSEQLTGAGIKVYRMTTIGDQEKAMMEAFSVAEEDVDIILITGGLGPTSDDRTKETLAKYFDSPVEMNEKALRELKAFMTSRGRSLNGLTRKQAELPVKCEMISNPRGTAPGMLFKRNGKVFISMPGVPHEMKDMITRSVLPLLKNLFDLPVIHHKIIRTAGIGESWLAEKIEKWEKALPAHIRLAYLPTFGDIKIRLTAIGEDAGKLREETERLARAVIPLIDRYVYGFDDETLESVIGRLLKNQGCTLALAESCTGGYISHVITRVPGSSEYFNGAVVPYQNEMKIARLGVHRETIEKFGAVSEETVREMADGVREKFQSDYGLASSGIAGPGGGTPQKPVGLVWLACSGPEGTSVRKLELTYDRVVNIRFSTVIALHMLHQSLREKDGESS